jgi:D-alanyl-lipoteichoic acid acyltransferase DltB (MBOAT superfamily)
MGIYYLLGFLVLMLAVLGIFTLILAFKDFQKREFQSLEEKSKWRRIISFVPFGAVSYLYKFRKT